MVDGDLSRPDDWLRVALDSLRFSPHQPVGHPVKCKPPTLAASPAVPPVFYKSTFLRRALRRGFRSFLQEKRVCACTHENHHGAAAAARRPREPPAALRGSRRSASVGARARVGGWPTPPLWWGGEAGAATSAARRRGETGPVARGGAATATRHAAAWNRYQEQSCANNVAFTFSMSKWVPTRIPGRQRADQSEGKDAKQIYNQLGPSSSR